MLQSFLLSPVISVSVAGIASVAANAICYRAFGLRPWRPGGRAEPLASWRAVLAGVLGLAAAGVGIWREWVQLHQMVALGIVAFDSNFAFEQALQVSCIGLGFAMFLRNYFGQVADPSWRMLGILFFGTYLFVAGCDVLVSWVT